MGTRFSKTKTTNKQFRNLYLRSDISSCDGQNKRQQKRPYFSDEKSTVVEVYVFEMHKSRRGLAFPPLPLMAAFTGLCHIKTRVLPAENHQQTIHQENKHGRGNDSCLLDQYFRQERTRIEEEWNHVFYTQSCRLQIGSVRAIN